jgi:transposase
MKRKDNVPTLLQRRRYDAEFKASAVRMLQNGQSVPEVSRALGVGESLLHKWRSASKKQAFEGGDRTEIERLRRQVRQLETERDILKKALSIFSRST